MAYITRNANIVLLFLILISATALVAATVFFQENFDRVNKAYESAKTNLAEINKDLGAKQQALETIKNELGLKSAREEEFTQQYSTVREQKTQLEGANTQLEQLKNSLETELDETQSTLQSIKNTLEAVKGENEILTKDLAAAQANVVRLKKDKDDLTATLASRNSKITCLETEKAKPDAEEGTCS